MGSKFEEVTQRYEHEIRAIDERLKKLEHSQTYEFTNHRQDGSLSTNAQELRKEISRLVVRIINESESDSDKIAELF